MKEKERGKYEGRREMVGSEGEREEGREGKRKGGSGGGREERSGGKLKGRERGSTNREKKKTLETEIGMLETGTGVLFCGHH